MPGAPPTISIDDASVHLVSVPLRRPHRFAGGELTERRLVLVRLGGSGTEGWGEAAPVPGYSPDTAQGAFSALAKVAESLVGQDPTHPGSAGSILLDEATPSARHALEAAMWDLWGRAAGVSMASLAGGRPGLVPVTGVLGLGSDAEEAAVAARRLLDSGHTRVKVKLDGPGDLPFLTALADALPPGAVAADANGSLPPDMAGLLADRLASIRLAYLEQPFPPGNLTASAIVNEALPVCLDEEITDPPAARRALAVGAGSLVSVKPGRLGGLSVALQVLAIARLAGAGALVGGQLESGIGRAASRALATVPGFTEPGEVGPSIVYLTHDVVKGPARLGPGRGVFVPDSPGWGGAVDADSVMRCTLQRVDAR
jgi:O-succinylbenzoate synthase